MTAVLLFGTTVAVAGSQPRKVKVKSVVKASSGNGMMKAPMKAISNASALVGAYTAVGSNRTDIASWPVTIAADNSSSNKVWIANLSPFFYSEGCEAPTYNYFYGTLNAAKTELHVPVGQRMTGTYSFTGGNTQYSNQVICIGAFDEYDCDEGYINVHQDDIVFRIENNGNRLVLTDSVFFYCLSSDNTFWMLDMVYNNTTLTKEAGQDDGVITLTTAGTLDTKVSGTETSLVIRGPLNGADLKVLRDMSTTGNLTSLDISGANIVGGNTTKYYDDYTAKNDNVLPPYLFYSSKLENLVLPNSITKLDYGCLSNCKKLTSITIPASVTVLYSSCFSGSSAMSAIYVENGSASYTHYSGVLYTKDGKTLVKYPEGKTGTSYTVNSGVTKIGDQAFSNAKLTSITLPTTLKEFGSMVFYYSSLTALSIPASVTAVSTSSFSAMTALTSFSVASGNAVLSTDSRGALFDKNKTILKAYPQGNTSTTYTIPSTVTEIEYDAFWTNKYLKKITMPDNVTTIGGYAFASCSSLEEINIPAKVTKIDSYAFSSNAAMKSVTSAITSPTALSETVFNSIPSTATLYVPAGTKSKYQSLAGWNKFTNIVEQGGGGQYKTYLYFVGSSSDWNTVKDKPLYCENNDGVYQGFMYLDGDFKFKEYDSWDENYGMGTATGKIASDGSNFNISSSDAGFYAVQLNVPEQTYSFTRIYFIDVVGNCVAGNDWSDGTKLTTYNVSENCWEGDVIFNSGGESFKLRGNGTWNKEDGNWGGTLENVLNGSDNDLITPYTGKCHLKFYVSCNTKSYLVMSPVSDNPTAKGSGTLADPFNSIAANNKGQELAVGQSTSEKYYVKGKISYVKFPFSSDYGTATFYISDDGTRNNEFYVYATYYLENKSWVTGNPQIAVGDEVIIYGTVSNYNGTSETTDKKSYVYSHNGMTRISGGVAFNNGTMTLTMTTAGNLQTAIASSGYSAASVRELVITGPINGTDIRYIRQLAGINYSNSSVTATLETLNLENANIVSGGEYYKSPAYATSDNVVGLSMFADTQLKYIFLPKSATTIMSQAFGNCKQLMGVTVYNKVTSVPGNLFIDCSALCYIDWQPTRGLTSGMLPTSSVRNPNLLLYVTSSSYAPYTTPNVVVGSTATQVTLTNGYAFWAPREFTATNISYSRSFTKTTGNGSAQGWETITLPFQPTKISHATKGELVPFGRWSGTSDTKKPFWLYGFGSSGFTASNYLYANQPYIIAMPNNTKYDDAYRVNGTVTFSATSATVKASSQAVGTTNGVRTLRPAYETVEATNNKYVLNANGSQFVTYRAASPFEAYFTTTEANARGFIDIFDELPTGIESIPTVGTDETPENVYDLQGQKVVTPQRGIYIRNGKKVIVR